MGVVALGDNAEGLGFQNHLGPVLRLPQMELGWDARRQAYRELRAIQPAHQGARMGLRDHGEGVVERQHRFPGVERYFFSMNMEEYAAGYLAPPCGIDPQDWQELEEVEAQGRQRMHFPDPNSDRFYFINDQGQREYAQQRIVPAERGAPQGNGLGGLAGRFDRLVHRNARGGLVAAFD